MDSQVCKLSFCQWLFPKAVLIALNAENTKEYISNCFIVCTNQLALTLCQECAFGDTWPVRRLVTSRWCEASGSKLTCQFWCDRILQICRVETHTHFPLPDHQPTWTRLQYVTENFTINYHKHDVWIVHYLSRIRFLVESSCRRCSYKRTEYESDFSFF